MLAIFTDTLDCFQSDQISKFLNTVVQFDWQRHTKYSNAVANTATGALTMAHTDATLYKGVTA